MNRKREYGTQAEIEAARSETFNRIVGVVADFFHIDPAQILGTSKRKPVCHARRACYFLIREQGASYERIGKVIGGRWHTTPLIGILDFTYDLKHDPQLRRQVEMMRNEIQRRNPRA